MLRDFLRQKRKLFVDLISFIIQQQRLAKFVTCLGSGCHICASEILRCFLWCHWKQWTTAQIRCMARQESKMINQHMPAILTMILILFGAQMALGAGSDNNYSSTPQSQTAIMKLWRSSRIKNIRKQSALQIAEKSAQNDADIQNLLGCSSQNRQTWCSRWLLPTRVEVSKHKGALEYQGELFLMRGDKDAVRLIWQAR